MPGSWFGDTGDLTTLPFYDMVAQVSSQTGMPARNIYALVVIGIAFLGMIVGAVKTKSALIAIFVFVCILFFGSSASIIPMWLPFVILVVGLAVLYLRREMSYV
jgi:CHASE2 domain-containing sensor protein